MGYIPLVRDEQPMNYAARQVLQKPQQLTVDGIPRVAFQDVMEHRNPYSSYFHRYERIAAHKLRANAVKHPVQDEKAQTLKERKLEAARRHEAELLHKGTTFDASV
ncbi:hypothetical protein [Alkalicoccus luteus]|uniref:Uncharacterized protein n=1 Tax=Alkalicoccus luteus TaxID=1237094 RepID=A0A969PTS6_9BACI|nr:hypothetical protein [Alkalicoccus luteus]NJP39163.1 hypothetical protein [Alkalicoccus luteus]